MDVVTGDIPENLLHMSGELGRVDIHTYTPTNHVHTGAWLIWAAIVGRDGRLWSLIIPICYNMYTVCIGHSGVSEWTTSASIPR
jgi:hypothetical protein